MKNRDKKKLLHFSSLIFGSGLLAKALAIPHSIIVAKFLSPSGFGILQIINIVMKYLGYAQLGILQGMNRNVPRAYANKEFKKVNQIKNLAFSWLIIIVLCIILVIWSIFLFTNIFPEVINQYILILITFIIIISRANAYLKPVLKTEGKFITIGKVVTVNSFTSPIIGIFLVVYFNLSGAMLAILVSHLITLASYLYIYNNIKINFYFNYNLFKEQISSGFLIFISKTSENLIISISILLIGFFYNSIEVGIFSFGYLTLVNIRKLSSSINIFFYRDIMITKGTEDIENDYHKKILNMPYIFNQYINTILLVIFSILYVALIPVYLDKYNSSIPIFHVIAFGLIFYNSRLFQSQFFNATNQLKLRFLIIVVGLIVNVLFLFIIFKYSFSLYLVALSCSMTFIIISALFMLIAMKQIYNSYKKGLFLLFKTFIIASINSIIIYNSSSLISFNFDPLIILIANIIIKCTVAFIINYLLFSILYINNSFRNELNRIFYLIFNLITDKIKSTSPNIK